MEFSNLRFEQRPIRRYLNRTTWVAGLVISLILLWIIMPHEVLIWLLLPIVAGLGWVASYGWKSAIRVIGRTINRLEQI